MFSSLKLFCLLSSVWHVNAMTVPTTPHIDDHTFETIVDVINDEPLNLDDFCWSDLLNSCSIIGNFTRYTVGLSFPVNIDCTTQNDGSELKRTQSNRYFYEHFRQFEVIALNGCGINVAYRQKNTNYENLLGIEYVPDPINVRHLTLEMFKVHGDLNRGAFLPFKNTKTLYLTNNKIDSLNEGSFDGLNMLEELIIHENNIQSMHQSTFQPCSESLKRLVIKESHLILGDFVPSKNLIELAISTKQLNWTSLTIGINSLRVAIISNVKNITYNKTAVARTFKNLTKMEVKFCGLTEFPIDRYPRLLHLNVSHNDLRNVSVKEMHMFGLHTFDICHNNFSSIDGSLLSSLWDLEYFYATHNRINRINPKSFQNNYNLKIVDLRFNRIQKIPIDAAIFISATHLQFLIDNNNFDCAWVNHFYGLDPRIFTTKFVYTKDFIDVNIKGLRCSYFSSELRYHTHLYEMDDFHNGKQGQQPNPVEVFRRNPKHTAFLTICILIVGVSCLLISLFFYVKYRTLTTTLNSNSMYESDKQKNNKDKTENRPDVIIQDRVMSTRQLEMSNRLMLPKSASSPRSIEFEEPDHHGIEFKESVGIYTEKRKASLPNRFECVPIGTHKVVFDIEPDTLVN